ncbi:MAG: alkene reductase [Kiloniellales bacterium]
MSDRAHSDAARLGEARLGERADLFVPFVLGPHVLENRLVMAPLTRNRAGPGNVPQPINVTYYQQRASAGLIVTEATQVSPQGVGYPNTPGIHSAEQVVGWRKVTEAVHKAGGRIFLQLWHVGRISHPSLQPGGALPVAPSAIKPAGKAFTHEGLQPFVTPRALETHEVPGIIADFRMAAANALQAGFDGVEIHAANGYLLDQFLRDSTNRRSDAYGGSLEKRARLLLDATDAVASVWGADRVGVRLSPVNAFNDISDSDPQRSFTYAARELGRLDLAYLHVVELGFEDGTQRDRAFDFDALREAFGGPYIANGGYDKAQAQAALSSGHADLVAIGKLFLANPDLPQRWRSDATLNEPDPATFYGGNEQGYTDYPALGESAQAASV